MSFTDDVNPEHEIAISVKNSLAQIKEAILSYKGHDPVLKKLKSKAMEFVNESDTRGNSFPMEKLLARVKKTQAKSSSEDVVVFLKSIQEHIDIAIDGIQRIVEKNLGLVGYLVNRFLKNESSYSREDRIQDGNAGLIKAAYRFDPERNIKFNTYACWWIMQEARLGYMAMSRTIRWPSSVYQAMGKGEEIFLASMGKNANVVFAATFAEPVSMDAPLNSESTDSLVEITEQPDAIPIEDSVDNHQVSTIINNSIDSLLTNREALVVRARFGIAQQSDHILADIGRELNVSPERVRIIQRNALRKLKKCLNIETLKENYA